MSFVREFKEFALRGNVMDLAVGVIIGAAFGKIVNSVIADLIMPVVGKVVGNVDFSNLYVRLSDGITPGLPLSEAKKLGPVFAYGNFITEFINFLILALGIFIMVKVMNAARRKFELEKGPVPPAAPPEELVVLREIRDALKK
jgi:large conductance mechanosensitive channel